MTIQPQATSPLAARHEKRSRVEAEFPLPIPSLPRLPTFIGLVSMSMRAWRDFGIRAGCSMVSNSATRFRFVPSAVTMARSFTIARCFQLLIVVTETPSASAACW